MVTGMTREQAVRWVGRHVRQVSGPVAAGSRFRLHRVSAEQLDLSSEG